MFWWQKSVKTRTKLNLKPNSSSAGGGGRVGVEATAALAAHLFGGKLNFLGSYFFTGNYLMIMAMKAGCLPTQWEGQTPSSARGQRGTHRKWQSQEDRSPAILHPFPLVCSRISFPEIYLRIPVRIYLRLHTETNASIYVFPANSLTHQSHWGWLWAFTSWARGAPFPPTCLWI